MCIRSHRNDRVAKDCQIRPAALALDGIARVLLCRNRNASRASNECPPAEEPMMPTRFGSIFHSLALRPNHPDGARRILETVQGDDSLPTQADISRRNTRCHSSQANRRSLCLHAARARHNLRREKSPSPRRKLLPRRRRYGETRNVFIVLAQRTRSAIGPKGNRGLCRHDRSGAEQSRELKH